MIWTLYVSKYPGIVKGKKRHLSLKRIAQILFILSFKTNDNEHTDLFYKMRALNCKQWMNLLSKNNYLQLIHYWASLMHTNNSLHLDDFR